MPCQDISVAGKQAGISEGTRSGLWSEIVRLIGELSPRYVIVENVANLLSGPSERRGGWFGRILGDLAECGYDAEWENIPASALGAPHRRERVWIVGYPSQNTDSKQRGRKGEMGRDRLVSAQRIEEANKPSGPSGAKGDVAHPHINHAQGQQPGGFDAQGWAGQITGPPGPLLAGIGREWRVEPDVGRVAHGVSNRAHRLAALGNAVVPQIPELIGRAILASMNPRSKPPAAFAVDRATAPGVNASGGF